MESSFSAANASKRNALGRGLGALIPGGEARRELFHCPVDQIVPMAGQPRTTIDPTSLRELADSIEESGVIQPILLKREEGRYRLIAGERRWRAAKLAGIDKIPALVKDVDDDEAFALALVENVQRADLTAIEEARACRRLIDEIGKARSTVANTLRLLDLPDVVQDHVAAGRLSAGHARAVLSVAKEDREAFASRVIEGNLSVREAEAEARHEVEPEPIVPAPEPSAPGAAKRGSSSSAKGKVVAFPTTHPRNERGANLARLERMLREALHTDVAIVDREGSGVIELRYDSDATLEALVDRLLGRG
jgi:ParB family chromosome partitioning protein